MPIVDLGLQNKIYPSELGIDNRKIATLGFKLDGRCRQPKLS
jgi:hypothetical protein